jgi:uncharacterized SAM-binding protein YcdF (DUF218 family)
VKKRSRAFKFFLIFAGALAAWILFAPVLAQILIVEKPLARRADALLVLAGSATYKERTKRAAEIFNQGIAARILLTDDGGRGGWNSVEGRNTPFVELARRDLVERGVPAEAIEILEPQVDGTIDEARLLERKVKVENYRSLLLVTSAYHTRRALRTFERVLPSTEIGIEHAPASGEKTPSPYFWWLKRAGWNSVAAEYVKTVYYWLYY